MAYPARIDPQLIGEVALGLVEVHGWSAFSLRGLAKALGVTPNALYRHIGDRNGLDVEVGAAAARVLDQHLVAAAGDLQGVDRLVVLSHAYASFGTDRPHAYRAFIDGKPDLDDARLTAWLSPLRRIRQTIAPLVPLAAGAAGIALIALLHGRVDLAAGPLRATTANDGLTDAVHALLAGFRSLGEVEGPRPRKG